MASVTPSDHEYITCIHTMAVFGFGDDPSSMIVLTCHTPPAKKKVYSMIAGLDDTT